MSRRLIPLVMILSTFGFFKGNVPAAEPEQKLSAAAFKLFEEGNYKDALEQFQKLLLDKQSSPKNVGNYLNHVSHCLGQLARINELEAIRDEAITLHGENWLFLYDAANLFIRDQHYGSVINGEFHRGSQRGGGGQQVNVQEQDRVRGIQLFLKSESLLLKELNTGEKISKSRQDQFYFDFANALMMNRGGGQVFRLQVLTDLSTLPEPEEMQYRFYGRSSNTSGAPVDENGEPILFAVPESFEAAQNDGERWRWVLEQASQVSEEARHKASSQIADFSHSQFGVQTLRYYPGFWDRFSEVTEYDSETAPYSLHTLKDNETLARLANGIKRFDLPEDYDFIKRYQQLVDESRDLQGENAIGRLIQIYRNRRQYPQAAATLKQAIKLYGPGHNKSREKELEQIVGNWGEFQPAQQTQVAGTGSVINFKFRNATNLKLTAYELKIEQLLKDTISHLKSSPKEIKPEYTNIEQIGHQIVTKNEKKYRGEQVANWSVDLKPYENHFDKLETINTPLQKPGAYLVVGQLADGNTTRIVVWVNDTIIVKKNAGKKIWFYVADAETGKPIQKAHVEFFGYHVERLPRNKGSRLKITTKQMAEYTDENGQVYSELDEVANRYQWMAIARTKSGRLAHFGFGHYWHRGSRDQTKQRAKVFFTTDRPVYRPEDKVHFKFWIRRTDYSRDDYHDFANQKFKVRLNDSQGKEIFKKEFQTDAYGGLEGDYELPEEAELGNYYLSIVEHGRVSGGGSFRVEEYKKPEFEVTVEAPDEPVQLGEKVTATIKAKYYFGAPVQNAKVHYTVKRSNYSNRWYPAGRWDWLYGNGYWWFAEDWNWYPGWSKWGCSRPVPYWWPVNQGPPEVVLDQEVEIGPEGTVKVEIDTAIAKAIHSDKDHEYSITAEVVDQSRRTIVGSGKVLVAREPFQVTGWGNRGFYQAGDKVEATFKAHTLDQKPVKGTGELKLLKISYDADARPTETVVESWNLDSDEAGFAKQVFNAADPGQYRLSYTLTDEEGHTREGAYIFQVRGPGFRGDGYQYNDLELTLEKKEYQPGDKVRLLINTNRPGSTVMLFIRPENQVYMAPHTLNLQGKSTTFELDISKSDMPNFFVEAMTVSRGELHQVTRNIVVPPEKRITNIEVIPTQEKYQPGEEAKLQLKLTDLQGNPVDSSVILTVYDKSIEYISGGSTVAEIKKLFWDFKRHHRPDSQTSWVHHTYNLMKPQEQRMQSLGVFGDLINENLMGLNGDVFFGARLGRGGVGGGMLAKSFSAPMPVSALGGTQAIEESAVATEGEVADRDSSPAHAEPALRSNFEDTAFWAGALTPDENGIVNVSFPLPDSLTTWKIRSWSMGAGTRVGQGETEIITSKNLLVRLQAPRFFVETDEVVLSANVHSYLENDKDVTVQLELDGNTLESLTDLSQVVTIKAGEEQRIDWRVKVTNSGEAILRMKALTDEESDAVEMKFPVYLHGSEIMHSYAGSLRPEDTIGKVEFDIPTARIEDQSRFEVRFSPSLAAAMVDALPYLVNYPHKTTDTTVHRFSSTVITYNILKEMGIDLKALKEKQVNLNAQELGDPQVRAAQWKRFKENPVFDPDEVERMMKKHVQDLNEIQLSDGGWGWLWGYRERSTPHLTAQVVHGLQLAQKNNIALLPGMLEKGTDWLKRYQEKQVQLLKNWEENEQKKKKHKEYKRLASHLDAYVFMVLVEGEVVNRQMLKYLKRDRVELSVYAKALFGLALHKLGEEQELNKVMKNLEQYLVQDDENQTAWLQLPDGGYWWYWYGSGSEANAVYLKLLAKTEPRSDRTSRLAKYLLNNRKHSSYWNSTRDTALAIEALAEFMVASGENKPEMTVEVWFDGQKQKEVKITPETLFDFDNSFVIEGAELTSGRHTLELRKSGSGPLYYNAYSSNFSQEEFLKKAGLEVKIERFYYKLIRDDQEKQVAGDRGQAVGQRTEKYRREPIVNNAQIKSGDLIEVELVIDTKNDYEYLILEDYKGAGLEPVDLRSGYTGNSLGAYLQFRDEKVTAYVRHLPHGKHNLIYRLRAEIPGRFSVLPAKGLGMHAPELKGNSDELKVEIVD